MCIILFSAPGDYVSGRYTIEIPARTKTAILMVMTNDDDIAELTETFTATIVDTCDLASVGNPSTGYVNILDNDSECILEVDDSENVGNNI